MHRRRNRRGRGRVYRRRGLGSPCGRGRSRGENGRGSGEVRHWRPSAKVKRHKDLRSLGLREDIEVSLELNFEIAERKRAQAEACATNEKERRPDAGATSQNKKAPVRPARNSDKRHCTGMKLILSSKMVFTG